MAAQALLRSGRPPTQVRAAASLAALPLLTGSRREGRLLGASSSAAWVAVADDVLVLVAGDAVRLPNGVGMAARSGGFFDHLTPGDLVVAGRRLVVAPRLRVAVRRWWDPHPRLPQVTPRAVMSRLGEIGNYPASFGDQGLGAALAACDGERLLAAARSLLGRGSGLTPEGDDLLAAALASFRLIGAAVGTGAPTALVDAVSEELSELAADRTTSLSASLLRHALAGNVADPVADALRALTGHRRPGVAFEHLAGVGHSSGPALAAGVVIGATAACGEMRP